MFVAWRCFIEYYLQIRDLQWEYLPGAKKAFDASLKNGVISSLQAAFETLGSSSKKQFLIVHVSVFCIASVIFQVANYNAT